MVSIQDLEKAAGTIQGPPHSAPPGGKIYHLWSFNLRCRSPHSLLQNRYLGQIKRRDSIISSVQATPSHKGLHPKQQEVESLEPAQHKLLPVEVLPGGEKIGQGRDRHDRSLTADSAPRSEGRAIPSTK